MKNNLRYLAQQFKGLNGCWGATNKIKDSWCRKMVRSILNENRNRIGRALYREVVRVEDALGRSRI